MIFYKFGIVLLELTITQARCMAGCSLRLCIEAGLGPDCFRNYFPCHWPFKVSELKDTGFTAAELRDAGFTDVTLLARAGFSTSELEAAGFDRHEAAASAGFRARESFEGSLEASFAAAVCSRLRRAASQGATDTMAKRWPQGHADAASSVFSQGKR